MIETPRPSGYVFDSLGPEDLPDIMAVERASFARPWPETEFAAEFGKPYAFFLGVRHQGRAVAVLLYWVIFPEIHIASLGVHPDHRRRGLAAQLLHLLMEVGSELGASQIDLEVRERNVAAQNLYEKLGFKRVGRRKAYYDDTGEDAFLYSYFFDSPQANDDIS